VVDEPVDHCGGGDVVAEDFTPVAERLVGGDDQAGSFVAGGHELEEQIGGFGFERYVADLVDLCRRRHSSTYAEPGTMPTGRLGRHGIACGGGIWPRPGHRWSA
jgi:hypothetical protein